MSRQIRGRPGHGPWAEQIVHVPVGDVALEGDLTLAPQATGVVAFAHGSGSSRHSPRNRQVAGALHDAGFATLLFDLLTPDEDAVDQATGRLRFDIDLLGGRLLAGIKWLHAAESTRRLPLGLFGASTGGAAALVAAARVPDRVAAVVSRGGRPDLAGADVLAAVRAPTLLVVGERDEEVLQLNRDAADQLSAEHVITVVPGATHLFEERGALAEVSRHAADWFGRWLRRPPEGGG